MARLDTADERRKYKRVLVDFPATYQVHGMPVSGRAFNACNRGMLIESLMSLDMAIHILYRLKKSGINHFVLGFTLKETYWAEAELRHFHLRFLGDRLCKSRLGFFISKIRQECMTP